MLAVAFDVLDTLAPTAHIVERLDASAGDSDAALAAVAEAVRAYPDTLRVLRELESLNVPVALAGAAPDWLVRRIADVLWFRGALLPASDPDMMAAIETWAALPADRIWFVTSRARAADTARAAGINAIVIGDARTPADDDARYDVATVGGVLDVLRGPYTRAALNLRYIFRTVVEITDPGTPVT